MATTLIDTRKAIMPQIEASWNEWIKTDACDRTLFGHRAALNASEFKHGETPWTNKQSVLERNAVHGNKLISLYIELRIKVADRLPIWRFFEVDAGAVGSMKDKIATLKKVKKVLKKQRRFGMKLSDATDLFLYRNDVCMWRIEKELKEYAENEKSIKAAKKRNAALRRAKKREARKKQITIGRVIMGRIARRR